MYKQAGKICIASLWWACSVLCLDVKILIGAFLPVKLFCCFKLITHLSSRPFLSFGSAYATERIQVRDAHIWIYDLWNYRYITRAVQQMCKSHHYDDSDKQIINVSFFYLTMFIWQMCRTLSSQPAADNILTKSAHRVTLYNTSLSDWPWKSQRPASAAVCQPRTGIQISSIEHTLWMPSVESQPHTICGLDVCFFHRTATKEFFLNRK